MLTSTQPEERVGLAYSTLAGKTRAALKRSTHLQNIFKIQNDIFSMHFILRYLTLDFKYFVFSNLMYKHFKEYFRYVPTQAHAEIFTESRV